MSALASRSIAYRRLRAPAENEALLAKPALQEAAACCQQNIAGRGEHAFLASLRATARRRLLEEAVRYTRAYRDVELPRGDLSTAAVYMSGHQPQLFHAGVWAKNFALSHLASAHRQRLVEGPPAVAVNLIIDNDDCGVVAIKAPSGSVEQPHLETVPLDAGGAPVPFEQREINDLDLFDSFPSRVCAAMNGVVGQPLVTDLWRHAKEAARRSSNLGQAVAAARHSLEGEWGLQTLELPLSHICQTPEFAAFAAHLLIRGEAFRDAFNELLVEYRQVNRVRSQSHPAPALGNDGDWIEAPFWLWNSQQPTRRPVFIRNQPGVLEITNRQGDTLRLEGDEQQIATQLGELSSQGWKIRPRALITTMYARLVLSDFFIHGIGGAKYDQLTDALVQQFFDVPAPSFMTLTSTMHLPVDYPDVTAADLRDVEQKLRELTYHPEDFATSDTAHGQREIAELAADKHKWLAADPPRGEGWKRHQGITQANEALQPYIAPLREELLQQQQETTAALRVRKLLASREFSFCLFPAAQLRTAFYKMFPAAACDCHSRDI